MEATAVPRTVTMGASRQQRAVGRLARLILLVVASIASNTGNAGASGEFFMSRFTQGGFLFFFFNGNIGGGGKWREYCRRMISGVSGSRRGNRGRSRALAFKLASRLGAMLFFFRARSPKRSAINLSNFGHRGNQKFGFLFGRGSKLI